jgi:hypothetical protein
VSKDEKDGQMSLYWPASVPYHGSAFTVAGFLIASPVAGFPSATSSADVEKESELEITSVRRAYSVPPTAYRRRLREGELRIICLTPSPDQDWDYPMHVELETHEQDKCPE